MAKGEINMYEWSESMGEIIWNNDLKFRKHSAPTWFQNPTKQLSKRQWILTPLFQVFVNIFFPFPPLQFQIYFFAYIVSPKDRLKNEFGFRVIKEWPRWKIRHIWIEGHKWSRLSYEPIRWKAFSEKSVNIKHW